MIAAINGHCVGGGLEVALAADLRVARKDAGKMGLPEVNLGVLPGTGGTQRLSRVLGKSKAIELMAKGETFDFERGAGIGLINQIFDGGDFMAQVMDYARQFCPPHKAAKAVGRMKRAVQSGWEVTLEAGLALERENQQTIVRERGRQGRPRSLPGETQPVSSEVMFFCHPERGATTSRRTIAAVAIEYDPTQSAFTRIAVELRPPAARITLQNPPLNVIDVRMMDELRAALEQIEARPEISAIVFAGSERAFSSGVEIAEHTADKIRNTLAAFHSVIRVRRRQQEADYRLRAAALPRWRRRARTHVRHCLRFAAIRCGDSLKSSWPVIRRLPAWRCLPLWDRSWRRRWS